jgi:large subunit ribosomal protein L6
MSRIGKLPVEIPSGVKGAITNGVVAVEGPRGKLEFGVPRGVDVKVVDGKFIVSMTGADKQSKANYGTTRAHINNMVQGVTKGWKRALELSGVGFSAKLDGALLTLSVGYSHDVQIAIPAGVKCSATKTAIELESSDRALVGTLASKIRKVCPPEPYLGKGIKYAEEVVRRKAGKTGKK